MANTPHLPISDRKIRRLPCARIYHDPMIAANALPKAKGWRGQGGELEETPFIATTNRLSVVHL
jgi:hypothetical protein